MKGEKYEMGRLLSVALNQSILGPEMKDSEIVHGQVSSLLCSSPRPMGVQPSPSCSQGDAGDLVPSSGASDEQSFPQGGHL